MVDSNLSRFQKDLKKLIDRAEILYFSIIKELGLVEGETKKKLDAMKLPSFTEEYESWYSEAYQIVKQILPDRLSDFVVLYKNEKRKEVDYLTYTISDHLIGLRTSKGGEVKADSKAAVPKFEQQKNILKSVEKRFESSLFDIKQLIQADLFDNELDSSEELNKKGFIRGAGAISGVVLEKHLKQVCENHGIPIRKKNPSISDFNDLLKSNDVIEVPTWRLIQHLGDLRNLCDHNKDREPTKDEIIELINGVRKMSKTLY